MYLKVYKPMLHIKNFVTVMPSNATQKIKDLKFWYSLILASKKITKIINQVFSLFIRMARRMMKSKCMKKRCFEQHVHWMLWYLSWTIPTQMIEIQHQGCFVTLTSFFFFITDNTWINRENLHSIFFFWEKTIQLQSTSNSSQ